MKMFQAFGPSEHSTSLASDVEEENLKTERTDNLFLNRNLLTSGQCPAMLSNNKNIMERQMVVVDAFGRHLSGVRDNDAKNNGKYLVFCNQSVSESVLLCLKTIIFFLFWNICFYNLFDKRCSADITCYYEIIAYYNC